MYQTVDKFGQICLLLLYLSSSPKAYDWIQVNYEMFLHKEKTYDILTVICFQLF